MQKEKLSEIINKKVLYIIATVISVIIGAGQVLLIVTEHKYFSGGVWYMLAAAWFLLAGFLVYRYIKTVKNEKAEAKRIAEFKELYKIK